MFTGIIQAVVKVQSLQPRGDAARLTLEPVPGLGPVSGESISVNGCCLTVLPDLGWSFDLSAETLLRSNLGALKSGSTVNVERALRVGDALGGHFVSGHVDGLARLEAIQPQDLGAQWRLSVPADLARYIANKGSVCLDGVSLTPHGVEGQQFSVSLIPHTLSASALAARKVGDSLNLEVDLIARYLERLR